MNWGLVGALLCSECLCWAPEYGIEREAAGGGNSPGGDEDYCYPNGGEWRVYKVSRRLLYRCLCMAANFAQ